jgi:hypothetical protein
MQTRQKNEKDIVKDINLISAETIRELDKLSIEQKDILKKYREKIEKSRIDELKKELYES